MRLARPAAPLARALGVALALLPLVARAASLAPFASCAALQAHYHSAAEARVGPYGLSPAFPAPLFAAPLAAAAPEAAAAAAPPQPGADFSQTNVQVPGVDEPDIVKTDGTRVFVLHADRLTILAAAPGGSPRVVGMLRLPAYPSGMLLAEDELLVFAPDFGAPAGPARAPSLARLFIAPTVQSTLVMRVSFSDPANPSVRQTLRISGSFVAARAADGVARLITRDDPSRRLEFPPPGNLSDAEATERNKRLIRTSTAEDWLPTFELTSEAGQTRNGVLTSCPSLYASREEFSGFALLTVTTLPLGGTLTSGRSVSVASGAGDVYSTATSMYVATTAYQFDQGPDGAGFKTSLHRFGLTKLTARYVASGSVEGSVLNQFSMHEYQDTFFVATTLGAPWWSRRDLSVSKMSALKLSVGNSSLDVIGEVGNLGVGERIYAVRYLADLAYVVTFREVDPLYIIDLSKPTQLRVTGELKIPGFSSYLHPVAPGRLLGVGQEATLQGRTTGAKVTLFDVSTLLEPSELATWSLPGASSSVEWDHRAFLHWRPESVAVLPLTVYGGENEFAGSVVLEISENNITERGRVSLRNTLPGVGFLVPPSIERNLVLGMTNLWSTSYEYVQVNNLASLQVEGGVRLPDQATR